MRKRRNVVLKVTVECLSLDKVRKTDPEAALELASRQRHFFNAICDVVRNNT